MGATDHFEAMRLRRAFKRYPESDQMLAVEGRKRGILMEWRMPPCTPFFVKNLVTKKPDILVIGSKKRLDRLAYARTCFK